MGRDGRNLLRARHLTRPAINLDVPARQARKRIHGRNAALKVATDGLQWAIGAGQTDPNLAGSLNLSRIYAEQAGMISTI